MMKTDNAFGSYNITDWLPTTIKEVRSRGWDELDVILFSGDAYIDHPAFGPAVISRVLERLGLRVAVIPQPVTICAILKSWENHGYFLV